MNGETETPGDRWTPVAFEAPDGDAPFRALLVGLPDAKAAALLSAVDLLLSVHGIGLVRTEWLKPLGKGLHELRVRHDALRIERMFGGGRTPAPSPARGLRLRLFVHFYGDRRVLLLNGYDKGADGSERRQRREIARARSLLAQFRVQGS